jgi:hypothetical protein
MLTREVKIARRNGLQGSRQIGMSSIPQILLLVTEIDLQSPSDTSQFERHLNCCRWGTFEGDQEPEEFFIIAI